MLTVENYNCQYLKLDSPTIQKLKENLLLMPSEFTKVELEYNINCGETPIKKELQYTNFNYWSIDLSQNIAKNDILDEIIFKHIITGQEFSIDNLNINMSTATVGDYLTAISDLLIDNGLSTVGLSVVLVGNELRITGLPTGIVPISFNMSTTVEIFLFNFNSQGNWFYGLDYLYLRPASFNLVNFIDGVYRIKLIYTLLDGTTIEETQCFFADCTIKCKIASLLEDALEDDTLNKNMYLYYLALSTSGNCGGCNCAEMCELYERIVAYLNNPIIIDKLNSKSCCSGCN